MPPDGLTGFSITAASARPLLGAHIFFVTMHGRSACSLRSNSPAWATTGDERQRSATGLLTSTAIGDKQQRVGPASAPQGRVKKEVVLDYFAPQMRPEPPNKHPS
jgi:hypothetical protein